METWQKLLSRSVVNVDDLPFSPQDEEYKNKLKKVAEVFPIRINPYIMDQIKSAHDPMWKQVVPTAEELDDFFSDEELLVSDPLNEEGDMPVPELVHRYPDRVLLMINNQCPIGDDAGDGQASTRKRRGSGTNLHRDAAHVGALYRFLFRVGVVLSRDKLERLDGQRKSRQPVRRTGSRRLP